jgi:hypothetical protein
MIGLRILSEKKVIGIFLTMFSLNQLCTWHPQRLKEQGSGFLKKRGMLFLILGSRALDIVMHWIIHGFMETFLSII